MLSGTNYSSRKEDDFLKDIKEFIKFQEIPTQHKDIFFLEINKYDYDPIWQRILKLIMESNKEKEKENKKME